MTFRPLTVRCAFRLSIVNSSIFVFTDINITAVKMDDVASAHTENTNLRKIQQKLMQWEKKLAPLSTNQLNWLDRLQEVDVSVTLGFSIAQEHCRNATQNKTVSTGHR